MHDPRPAFRASAPILVLLALTGCSGIDWPGSSSSPTATATQPQAGAPPVSLAGRWRLSSPSRGQCNMTFAASSPAAADGTIAPEGGCPGNFFTSRHWAFEQGDLAVRDHNDELLAQFKFVDNRFEGKSAAGLPVTLARSGPPVQ